MSVCRECGAIIDWRQTTNGEWQPIDLDGAVHFPTCRERVDEQRRAVAAWYRAVADNRVQCGERR